MKSLMPFFKLSNGKIVIGYTTDRFFILRVSIRVLQMTPPLWQKVKRN